MQSLTLPWHRQAWQRDFRVWALTSLSLQQKRQWLTFSVPESSIQSSNSRLKTLWVGSSKQWEQSLKSQVAKNKDRDKQPYKCLLVWLKSTPLSASSLRPWQSLKQNRRQPASSRQCAARTKPSRRHRTRSVSQWSSDPSTENQCLKNNGRSMSCKRLLTTTSLWRISSRSLKWKALNSRSVLSSSRKRVIEAN